MRKYFYLSHYLIIIALVLIFLSVQIAQAGAGQNVSGFAWSENIGWVSFNSSNCDPDNNGLSNGGAGCPASGTPISNYGVNLDTIGVLSGYAWSENIGWISFNRSDAGVPPGSPDYGTYLAKIDDATKKLSGWARALANGDGWDGWLKLGCFGSECNRVNYGTSLNFIVSPVEFYSFSWSDVVLGWLSFNCTDSLVCPSSNYKVVTSASFNQPPSKPGIVGETWNHCSIQGRSIPIFSWTYSDPNGDPQESYEVEVDDNSSFNAPKFNHLVNSNSISYALDLSQDDDADWISQLSWNTTYFWRVRVKDNQGNWSEWSNADVFQTPLHAYPSPDFNWTPMAPTQGEVVVFNSDISVLYGGASVFSYLWTITQGSGTFVDTTNNASQYPHIVFDSAANQIKLAITDSDGYSCGTSARPVAATLPLPEYKEAPPASWLSPILAVINIFLTSWHNFATIL